VGVFWVGGVFFFFFFFFFSGVVGFFCWVFSFLVFLWLLGFVLGGVFFVVGWCFFWFFVCVLVFFWVWFFFFVFLFVCFVWERSFLKPSEPSKHLLPQPLL